MRIALFTDCFEEVNGVARTCREFAAFAQRRDLPFLVFHSSSNPGVEDRGSVRHARFRRSPLSVPVDPDLSFDILFLRHRAQVRRLLDEFRPDVIHITSPGDIGILGVIEAKSRKLPLIASWHTNIHQFAARRLDWMLKWAPAGIRSTLVNQCEKRVFDITAWYYAMADRLLAPNPELVSLLETRTRKPVALMRRGIDTVLFTPDRRDREPGPFVLGYVGRINSEKSVHVLAEVEKHLIKAGVTNYRFSIVGHGGEQEWLERNMKRAEFPGVLRGEPLARAYANMDLFVFPSRTDTFGNVVQEALASAVPCAVSPDGGPKFIITPGENGWVADTPAEFAAIALRLMRDPAQHALACSRARQAALDSTWDRIFEGVCDVYSAALQARAGAPAMRA